MQVLVTGGTGFIGERLVRTLAERGDTVTVLSRRAGTSKHATQVVWTPEARGSWLEEVEKADVVVHLAGKNILEKRWTDEHLRECRDSRVIPTKLIAEALRDAGSSSSSSSSNTKKRKTFISASAVGYYGFRDDDRVCDESSLPGDDVIAKLVVDWEASVSPAEGIDSIRVVKARIGVVLGPEGGALAQMLPIFRMGLGGSLGSGSQILPWVHAEDTVLALLFAIDTNTLSGPINITAPTPVPMREFAKVLGRVLHRPSFLPVPSFALRVIVGKGAEVVLTGQNALPKKLLEAGFTFRYPDLAQALTEAVVVAR